MKHIFLILPVVSGLILFGRPSFAATYTGEAEDDSSRYVTVEVSSESCESPDIRALQQKAGDMLVQLDVKRLSEKDRDAWNAFQKANALVLDQQWKRAAEAMTEVERKYPRSSWADDAGFWRIYSLEKNGLPLEEIFREYETYIGKYKHSKWTDTARSSLIGAGNRLAASGKPEYAEKIRPFTESDQLDIALSALVALQNMGDDSLPDIIKLYHSTPEPSIRDHILSSLSIIRSPKAIDFLIRVAETDSSAALRRKALMQLSACIYSPKSMQMSLITSQQALQRLQGASSSAITMPAIPAIPEGWAMPDVFQTYESYSPYEAYGLSSSSRQGAEKKEITDADRNKVIAAIKRIARTDPDDDIRGLAIHLVSQTGLKDEDIQFLETIVSSDTNPDIRQKGLMALFALPENRGIPSVISIAKANSQIQIRKAAIRLLGASKDPRARTALVEIARNGK